MVRSQVYRPDITRLLTNTSPDIVQEWLKYIKDGVNTGQEAGNSDHSKHFRKLSN